MPEAIKVSLDGEELRCFDRGGWEQVGHIIIDYRSFFAWADRLELVLEIERQAHKATLARLDGYKELTSIANDSNQLLLAQVDSYQQAANSEKKRKIWTAIGHAVAVVAMVTIGAVIVARP